MKNLKDLMVDQLKELYDAELQLKANMDKMAVETSHEALRHTFELRAKAMEGQTEKLGKVFSLLGERPGDRYSHVMEAIGKEVQQFLDQAPEPEVRDAGFIALVQKAKHYEIALYGTLKEYARELDNREAEKLLAEILLQEKEEDQLFTEQARSGINQRAGSPDAVSRRFAPSGTKITL